MTTQARHIGASRISNADGISSTLPIAIIKNRVTTSPRWIPLTPALDPIKNWMIKKSKRYRPNPTKPTTPEVITPPVHQVVVKDIYILK